MSGRLWDGPGRRSGKKAGYSAGLFGGEGPGREAAAGWLRSNRLPDRSRLRGGATPEEAGGVRGEEVGIFPQEMLAGFE